MTVFHPLDDRVLVRPDEPELFTKGGLIIPDTAKGRPESGTVVAVGPGDLILSSGKRKAPLVEPGQRVLFSRYAGSVELDLDGDKHFCMREEEIFGTLPQEAVVSES